MNNNNNNNKRVALPQDPNTPIEDEPPFGSTDPWLMPGAPGSLVAVMVQSVILWNASLTDGTDTRTTSGLPWLRACSQSMERLSLVSSLASKETGIRQWRTP